MSQSNVSWFKRQMLTQLEKITHGFIHWHDGDTQEFGTPDDPLEVKVTIHNQKFYKNFVLQGTQGAIESYINGEWDCDNLTVLVRIVIENEKLFLSADKKWAMPFFWLQRFRHWLKKNTLRGSKKNIRDHYDLSNDFF